MRCRTPHRNLLRAGVRRTLLSCAALLPASFLAPAVYAQTAEAGRDRTIADTDQLPGEDVVLDGSGSTGAITSYVWTDTQGNQIATGQVATVRLPDGFNRIGLTVNGQITDFASIIVSGVGDGLAGIGTLTPNQQATARALDDLCTGIFDLANRDSEIADDQLDLLSRCGSLIGGEGSTEDLAQAVGELGAEEFNALRTLSVVFAESQFQSVMDRLVALRAGTRGVSLAGLNLRIGDGVVSGEQLLASLRPLLGAGASADDVESGSLLENRMGMWMRGNVGKGHKSASIADGGFSSDQWGFTSGADYRLGASTIIGTAVGYGKADLQFSPGTRGGIETKSWSVSAYGTTYLNNIYVDAVVNFVNADYGSLRRVRYDETFGDTVDQTFHGTTKGDTLSAALAVGYDFVVGGFTFAPTLGYNYVDNSIDAFTEGQGNAASSGYTLNLAFNDQKYKSATGNLGIRATYAWKTSWGVVVPHFRGYYVREFEDELSAFTVRFASDPFSGTANPAPPIVVQSDEIDESYLRLAIGASAQFQQDVSAYFEYQRLAGFENVDFRDFTFGLRFQHSF